MLRKDKQNFTYVISYMNVVFIAQWLFGGNSESLQSSHVFARRQKLWKPQKIFKQTRVNFFTAKIWCYFFNNVTATLRALFA